MGLCWCNTNVIWCHVIITLREKKEVGNMVIALLICIFIIEIYIYKKSDKKYVSPQEYDYIVTFKDVEVGDKMLD